MAETDLPPNVLGKRDREAEADAEGEPSPKLARVGVSRQSLPEASDIYSDQENQPLSALSSLTRDPPGDISDAFHLPTSPTPFDPFSVPRDVLADISEAFDLSNPPTPRAQSPLSPPESPGVQIWLDPASPSLGSETAPPSDAGEAASPTGHAAESKWVEQVFNKKQDQLDKEFRGILSAGGGFDSDAEGMSAHRRKVALEPQQRKIEPRAVARAMARATGDHLGRQAPGLPKDPIEQEMASWRKTAVEGITELGNPGREQARETLLADAVSIHSTVYGLMEEQNLRERQLLQDVEKLKEAYREVGASFDPGREEFEAFLKEFKAQRRAAMQADGYKAMNKVLGEILPRYGIDPADHRLSLSGANSHTNESPTRQFDLDPRSRARGQPPSR